MFKSKLKGPISIQEAESAKLAILRLAQRESFQVLFKSLAEGTNERVAQNLRRLSPFLDEDGIIRLRCRLRRSGLSMQSKHPILLSSKHLVTEMLLTQKHVDNHHEGTEFVRSVVQQEFWVVGLRNALRRIKHHCVKCRKMAAQPLQPEMADLPPERVEASYPFQSTGVDYFGPFEVKFLRKTVKYWCCLFTCLATRAVHIEVVQGLDTDACMMAITRFMARRGRPHTIMSDNGTNFIGSAREFKELSRKWDQDILRNTLANQQVVWKFNPPAAPHFGGVWERLVRSCKKSMYSILGARCLTLPVLTTTMCLVEQTLNARPITPVSDDPDDLEALTPNHFLLGSRVIAQPLIPDATRYVDCRKMYKVAQAYNDMIWKRWTNEYIPQCNIRCKWNRSSRNLKVGELVWLVDDQLKRCYYRMARVIEVYPGGDGVVRSAKIKTAEGELRRPVVKLAPVFYECFRDENRAGNVGASDTVE